MRGNTKGVTWVRAVSDKTTNTKFFDHQREEGKGPIVDYDESLLKPWQTPNNTGTIWVAFGSGLFSLPHVVGTSKTQKPQFIELVINGDWVRVEPTAMVYHINSKVHTGWHRGATPQIRIDVWATGVAEPGKFVTFIDPTDDLQFSVFELKKQWAMQFSP